MKYVIRNNFVSVLPHVLKTAVSLPMPVLSDRLIIDKKAQSGKLSLEVPYREVLDALMKIILDVNQCRRSRQQNTSEHAIYKS